MNCRKDGIAQLTEYLQDNILVPVGDAKPFALRSHQNVKITTLLKPQIIHSEEVEETAAYWVLQRYRGCLREMDQSAIVQSTKFP